MEGTPRGTDLPPVPTVEVPDGLHIVEPGVRDLAAGIAADIRARGHFQNTPQTCRGVCILTSPTYRRMQHDDGSDPFARMRFRLGSLLVGQRLTFTIRPVGVWNDATPTADVLARLDAIAEGLVSA